MDKWVYKLVPIGTNEEALNDLGEDGWEVVGVIPPSPDNPHRVFRGGSGKIILKKQKPQE